MSTDVEGGEHVEPVAAADAAHGGVGAAAPRERAHFMEHALTVYGLQHCIDNLTSAVHQELSYWDRFYPQLKNMEALLKRKERRDRFCITSTDRDRREHRHMDTDTATGTMTHRHAHAGTFPNSQQASKGNP